MNPILLNIPESFETDRLILRCPREGDGPEYHAAITETYEQIKAWFGSWAKEPLSPETVEAMVREARAEYIQRTNLTLLCYLKETNTLVGRAFINHIDWSVPKGMLGYWTRQGYQGQGIGREAILAIMSFVFEQLKFQRLELYIDNRNEPSIRLFVGCGFQYDGRIRNYGWDNFGNMRDYLIYSMLPHEYGALSSICTQSAQNNFPVNVQTPVIV